MQRLIDSLAVSVCLCALLGVAAPAHAGFVTFVSGNGSDGAGCGLTPATACREIFGASGALSQTDEGGIIHVLPGEYVAFAVEGKSVDIIADGGQASVVNTVVGPIPNITGNAGIGINVGSGDVVRIRGFILNPEHGIAIGGAGGIVHLEDNTFIGVANRYGIIYQPSGASELYVKDSTIAREHGATGGGGILIKPTGSGSAKVVLDNVSVSDNSTGILIDGRTTTGTNNVTIRNSTFSGSTGNGLLAIDGGGGATNVAVEASTFSGNGTNGVGSNGVNTTVRMRNSTVTGNLRGIVAAASGKLISNGGNVVRGNTTNGAFTSTEAQQ